MRFQIRMRLAVAGAALVLVMSSCGGVIDPSKNRVQEFSGTLERGEVGPPHEVDSKSGEFSVRITALAPNPNIFMGVLWGQVQNGLCIRLQENIFARLDLTALAGQVNSGRYCVQIFDVGGITTTTTYTLAVSRP